MEQPDHSDIVSIKRLNSLCWIWCERQQQKQQQKLYECRHAKLCKSYLSETMTFYGIDVARVMLYYEHNTFRHTLHKILFQAN